MYTEPDQNLSSTSEPILLRQIHQNYFILHVSRSKKLEIKLTIFHYFLKLSHKLLKDVKITIGQILRGKICKRLEKFRATKCI